MEWSDFNYPLVGISISKWHNSSWHYIGQSHEDRNWHLADTCSLGPLAGCFVYIPLRTRFVFVFMSGQPKFLYETDLCGSVCVCARARVRACVCVLNHVQLIYGGLKRRDFQPIWLRWHYLYHSIFERHISLSHIDKCHLSGAIYIYVYRLVCVSWLMLHCLARPASYIL